MLSPLTGLIDAARPDSEAARQFASYVDGFLSDAPRLALYQPNLDVILRDWQTAGRALGPMIDQSPALLEARPLANDLSAIAAAGLEALSYLSTGNPATMQWRDAQLAKLDEAAKPKAALEFAIITSVRKLVNAAAEPPRTRANLSEPKK